MVKGWYLFFFSLRYVILIYCLDLQLNVVGFWKIRVVIFEKINEKINDFYGYYFKIILCKIKKKNFFVIL